LSRVCSIFSQLLQLFPRLEFQQSVSKHRAERHARGFPCWGQFVAMLFCQLAQAHSLREICGGLAASEGKLVHLGLHGAPPRSTLAYANEHRPWELYQTLFYQLGERCRTEASDRKRKFRFKNKLLSLDASLIKLSLSLYDWASYTRQKGAVKLHLVLDHDGYLPTFAVLTTGKRHEIQVARGMQFGPGTILVFDKGYADYSWWKQLTQEGVFFVTRLRDDARLEIVNRREVKPGSGVLRDDEIVLCGSRNPGAGLCLRRIEFRPEAGADTLVFVTNHTRLAAATIAAIYKDRWEIELFFKSVKQLLKVKTFVGTSENAVLTQIWTALIAMLLLRWLKLRSSYGWSLSNLLALLRQQLLVYRDLWTWLNQPFQGPPPLAAVQLPLDLTTGS